MARRMSQWMFVVLSVLLLVSAVLPAGADEAQVVDKKLDEAKEVAEEQTGVTTESAKSWGKWVFDKIPGYSGPAKQASKVIEEAQDTQAGKGAVERAKAYVSQGSQKFFTTKDQVQQSASGIFNKWSSWARGNAGKVYDSSKEQASSVGEKAGVKEEEL